MDSASISGSSSSSITATSLGWGGLGSSNRSIWDLCKKKTKISSGCNIISRNGYPCVPVPASSSLLLFGNQPSDGDQGLFPSLHVKALENRIQAPEEKGSIPGTNDMMKLFNDAQKNMMHLNKQRLNAVEELQKSKRENEVLLARLGHLEAERQASIVECDILKRQLHAFEAKPSGGFWNLQRAGGEGLKMKLYVSSIFSELMLHIDSMVLTGALSRSQGGALRSLVLSRDNYAAEMFAGIIGKDDKDLAKYLLPLLDVNQRHGLHIMHISPELAPITGCGALGAHVAGLSGAIRGRGNLVEVILPKYACMDMVDVESLREIEVDLYSFFGGHWHKNKIWTGIICGISVTFIEPLHPSNFFSRDHLYGYDDDFERFTYFCRASLDYLVKLGKQPHILHLHSWQTAIIAPLYWDVFENQGLSGTRILFTCHDFKHQCLQEPNKLALCGLDPKELHRLDRLQDNLDPRFVNLLKGGIVYSNWVTTVSPLYANDILTREQGLGLESTLITHKNKFTGIYNGLDESAWNPTCDSFISSAYSFQNLSGKAQCKADLRQQLGLSQSHNSIPLVGCLATEVSDMEMDLIKVALDCTLRKGAQFVGMGASKTPRIQMILEDLQQDYEKNQVASFIKYDEAIAHSVIAASDILLCISFHEPAGQLPLIAMKYGSVPVVKEVNAPYKSVIDADEPLHQNEITGFTFQSEKGADLVFALNRAIDRMNNDPHGWRTLIKNGMSKDFSWDATSEAYMDSYQFILQL